MIEPRKKALFVPLLGLTSLSAQTGPNVSKVIDAHCSGCHNGSMRIAEKLLAYSAAGSVAPSGGTPETLIRARQILSGTQKPRWSALIAAMRTKPPAIE